MQRNCLQQQMLVQLLPIQLCGGSSVVPIQLCGGSSVDSALWCQYSSDSNMYFSEENLAGINLPVQTAGFLAGSLRH